VTLDRSHDAPDDGGGLEAARAAARRLRRFGGQQLVREMTEIFVADVPSRIAVARDGLGSGNHRAVEYAAHSIKSSSGQFGAEAMQRLCADAERLAQRGELERVPRLLDAIETEFDRFCGWLARAADEPAADERPPS
jgi:HPt (histidine-containing phosphotransfer) domain-containing protein